MIRLSYSRSLTILSYKLSKSVASYLNTTFPFVFYNTGNPFLFCQYYNHFLPKTVVINAKHDSLQLMSRIKKKTCHFIYINVARHKTVDYKKKGAFAILNEPIQVETLEEVLYYSLDKNQKIS